jgi:hypothetical protein
MCSIIQYNTNSTYKGALSAIKLPRVFLQQSVRSGTRNEIESSVSTIFFFGLLRQIFGLLSLTILFVCLCLCFEENECMRVTVLMCWVGLTTNKLCRSIQFFPINLKSTHVLWMQDFLLEVSLDLYCSILRYRATVKSKLPVVLYSVASWSGRAAHNLDFWVILK